MTTDVIAGDLGQSVTLVCTATGVPEVRFKWISGSGATIESDADSVRPASELLADYLGYIIQTKRMSDTLFQSGLTIKRITDRELNKSFKCMAFNQKGETLKDMELRERGKPDPPNHIKLINITHNTAFFAWKPGFDGGDGQTFKIKYFKQEDNEQEVQQTNDNWILISGLEAGSQYSFSVCAVNGFGESECKKFNESSNVWTLTTDSDSSEALIDGLKTVNANPNNKSLSTIIMIIVFVLGLLLIILNASLVVCYLKWKKQIVSRTKAGSNGTKSKVKLTMLKDKSNGAAILMKAFSDDDISSSPHGVPTRLASKEPHNKSSGKRCEVLVMTDLHSSSSAQPMAVLLTDYDNHRLQDNQNCPDVIKAPLIDVSFSCCPMHLTDWIPSTLHCGTVHSAQCLECLQCPIGIHISSVCDIRILSNQYLV